MANGADSSYGAVSGNITTAAKLIVAARSSRNAILIQNTHATNDLYVGPDSSVTSSNGIKVAAGSSIEVPTRGSVYGIASAAATTVVFWEIF